ncbi:type I polyketide synthase [Streptomyces rimosus]|uniref:type I polyketide synthase n=1 Tax=Streptomyces rimosus TaxID=1927 RepID=UPI0007C57AB2|nr:type I polyketide synthase [Streptomyces rimosus]
MPDNRPAVREPIAIVGMSAIMPGAPDLDAFWQAIVEGRDLVTDVPADRWLAADHYDPDPRAEDKTYCKRGAFLPTVDFDPLAFGLSPRSVAATDSAQLLALIVADRLLADLGPARAGPDGERVGVYVGCAALQLMGEMSARTGRPVWRKVLREEGIAPERVEEVCDRIAGHCVPWQTATFPGLLSNVVAGRIANTFDLHGTNLTVDAACASSLAALSVAVDDLVLGRADLVVTGGVDTLNDPMTFTCFSKTPALSPTGDCRPFAESADGTLLGEGVALFALKRLADAERDDDRIFAVVRGIGSASDGSGTSIYAPLAAGQVRAMRRAYAAADYDPGTVGLVEAHGTGTVAGDTTEVAALREVFEASDGPGRQWCGLGSVKSQIGHAKAAAGAAGLLKAVLALHHKVLPPTIKAEPTNPALELDRSPFYLNTSARPWVHLADHPRRASVSSFGFGGSNFHVALEEYVRADAVPGVRRPAPRCAARPSELVPLSADAPEGLLARCRELVESMGERERLSETARRAQGAFDATAECRLALVASDCAELATKLEQAATVIERQPEDAFSGPSGMHYGTGGMGVGRIAFVFPGQGTQHLRMGTDMALHFPRALAVWQHAAELGLGERPLTDVVFPRPASTEAGRRRHRAELTRTEWAQPALAAHALALLAVLDATRVRPDCVAGHSFGELTALHAARAFDADTLLRLARRRGELMRDAGTGPDGGAMLAVDACAERVSGVTGLVPDGPAGDLRIANDNAPGQVVLAGSESEVAQAAERCAAAGLTARRLDVATAFHSPLVARAAEPLAEFLAAQTVRAPLLDVYGNTAAAVYPVRPDLVRQTVAGHLAAPVRFVDMIKAMYGDGVRTFVEVGPGSVLSGLIGEILHDVPHHAVPTAPSGISGVTGLHNALARLATLGVPLLPAGLWEHHATPRTAPEPRSGPQVRMAINGGNHGRRYPPQADDRQTGERQTDGPQTAGPQMDESQTDRSQSATPVTETPMTDTEPVPAPAPPEAGTEVVRALLEVQRQTAEAHAAYLGLAAKAVEALAGAEGNTVQEPDGTGWGDDLADPAAPAAPVAPMVAEESPAPPLPPTESGRPTPPEAPPSPNLSPSDMEALVLRTVAEKTGYPVDILAPHMELEADLGLDSITRVQVLAALREAFPHLEAVDRADIGQLATLQTVGEVAGALRELLAVTAPADGAPPPAATDSAPAGPAPPDVRVHRQVPTMVAEPAAGTPLPGLGEGPLSVVGDGTGLADEVVRLLGRHGVAAERHTDVPAGAAGVVFLGGMAEPASVAEAVARQREAFQAAHAVAPRMEQHGGVFVTVQDTGGWFGLRDCAPGRAWLGGIAALARTAAAEWPRASVKAVDCARGPRTDGEVAAAVVGELLGGGPSLNVGLPADGVRRTWAVRDEDAPGDAPPAPALGPLPVIVATGGTGGVTAEALVELARTCPARFVLIGRSKPDGPRANRIRATLAALEEAGSQARYVRTDIRDRAGLGAALAGVRAEWGPVTGLVHAAGVLADRRIRDKSAADFDEVFGVKVDGLAALLQETAADPLRLVCVFSSVVASYGNPGQCDYAMANETLNQVIAAERAGRPEALVRSLAWGPWQGGMVTPRLAELFRLDGVPLLSMEAGARAFAAELATAAPQPHVIISAGPADMLFGKASHAAHTANTAHAARTTHSTHTARTA